MTPTSSPSQNHRRSVHANSFGPFARSPALTDEALLMPQPNNPQPPRSEASSPLSKISPRTTLILIGLLIAYLLLRPTLERWTGKKLPGLGNDDQVADNRKSDAAPPSDDEDAKPDPNSSGKQSSSAEKSPSKTVASNDSSANPKTATNPDASKPAAKTPPKKGDQPPLGELTEIRRNVFKSTAGLIYGPGSEQGHRIKHVMRHAEDDPDRPVHGVFEGDQKTVLALIDEAYLLAQKRGPPDVRKESQDDRTVYTIDLRRRIGYVGGQRGARSKHPAAKKLKLILEDDRVITAYPE